MRIEFKLNELPLMTSVINRYYKALESGLQKRNLQKRKSDDVKISFNDILMSDTQAYSEMKKIKPILDCFERALYGIK